MSDDVHEVYAIRYGHHKRPSSANFIHGDPHDMLQPLDYFVWAIVGPAGTIVVDTGFDEATARKRGREMIRPVRDGLLALGIAPDSIRDVIISHLHYDHCENYDLFPQACYHLQDREMAYATGRCMCHERCARRSRSTTWSPWCARCLMVAPHFTTARTRSCPG